VSGTTFRQCYRATSETSLVACSLTDQLQAFSHHIQDEINWQPGLPIHHLIHDYLPARTLRSSDKLLLTVPRMALALSAKAFSVSAPSVWNSLSLSYNCRYTELFSTFKRSLNTELFDIAYFSKCELSA